MIRKLSYSIVFLLLLQIGILPAFAQTKVKDLPAASSVSDPDLLYVVVGSTLDRKATVGTVFESITGNKPLSRYASLNAAVAAVGSTQVGILIATNTTVSTSLTVPVTTLLAFGGGAMISVSSSQTLTINSSPKDWPLRQVFTGNGTCKLPNASVIYPQWFGAKMDGTDDGTLDTPGIQKAIDAFPQTAKPHAGGEVPIMGAIINDTLVIDKNSVMLTSKGWGVSNEAPYGGFLKWNGSAGEDMLHIKNCWMSGVENIRFIGKSTAKPSAAIKIERETLATTLLNHTFARQVFIGPLFGYDSDDAVQFDAGIVFAGTLDGDTNLLEHIHITKATIGIDIQNPNASVTQIDTLKVTNCDIGLKTNSFTVGSNWNFGSNETDLYITSGHRLSVRDFTTEGSSQYIFGEIASKAYIELGGFEVTNNIIPSGYMIDMDQGSYLELKNSHFVPANDYTFSPLFKIRVKSGGGSAGYQYVKIDNVTGIAQNQIDVTGPGGTLHRTQVHFTRPPGADSTFGANAINFLTGTEAFDEKRFDVAGAFNSFGGPLKVRKLAAPSGLTLTAVGGTGTMYSFRVSAITADGETEVSSAVTVSGPSSLDPTHYINASWNPVIGGIGYKLYGRIAESEQLIVTRYAWDIHTKPADGSVLSYKDDGSVTPSGALPTANTTGNATFENRSYFGDGTTALPALARLADTSHGIKFSGTATSFVQGGNELLIIGNGGTVQFNFAGPLIPNFGSFQWVDGTKLSRSADGIIAPINSGGGFGKFELATGVYVMAGSGSPEGVVTANVGSLYMRTNGGAGTTLYVKESGTGNTGWIAK